MERAPFRPIYWGDYSRTSFQTEDGLPIIRQKLESAFQDFHAVFVASSEHRCGYSVDAFPETYIVFEVGIFEEKTEPVTHTVEFRHMDGCRYACSHFITNLGASIGMVFPGRPLPMGPPALPGETEPTDEAIRNSCNFIHELIGPDSQRSMAVQGLRSLGGMAAKRPQNFQGHGAKLIGATLLMLKRFHDDDEMRMGIMYALAGMAKGCPDNLLLTAALKEGREDSNPLVRRLATPSLLEF